MYRTVLRLIELDGMRRIKSIRWMESESAPSPTRSQASTSSRNGDSGAVPTQRGNGESQLKQINDVPKFYGTRAKLPSWKQNFLFLAKLLGLFGIFSEGVDVPVANETMSIAALQEAFPHENVDPMLSASGNLFKWHEEVLYLQLLIPPKRFDIFFPITGGSSEGLGAF